MSIIKNCLSTLSIVLLSLCWTQPLSAQQNDHSLLSRYPGSTVEKHEMKEFDSYKLVTGYNTKKNELVGEAIEGKVTRIVYQNPVQRSTLEIYQNYHFDLDDFDLPLESIDELLPEL